MEQYFKPLHLACELDEFRPNMALIKVEHFIATCTNGTILVKDDLRITSNPLIREALETLNGKFIHMEAWKEMHKCEHVEFDDTYIYVHKNGSKKMFEYAEPNGEFFNIDSVVEQVRKLGEEPKRHMCLSGKLLGVIYKVFDSSEGSIHFHPTNGQNGVLLHPGTDLGIYAILMPRDTDDINRYMFL